MGPPASLPPSRGKVPPKGADEGDFLARIIYGGSPRDSSPQIKGWSRRTVGEGLKVNCPEGAREATLGCAPSRHFPEMDRCPL